LPVLSEIANVVQSNSYKARGSVQGVLTHAPRRHFSASYKLAILNEYEQTTDAGAKGALLRREGLYSSHIVEWRRARDVGALRELTPKLRRSKRTAESREIERLRRRNERLEDQLQKHKQVLEIQGKASELLSRLLAESTEETTQQPDRREP
jgi:transposase-like protein